MLYIEAWSDFHAEHLISMAKNRASRGAKLSSIAIITLYELGLGKEVLNLREHVTHVDYRIGDTPSGWDYVFNENEHA